jgi:hypothetical protein
MTPEELVTLTESINNRLVQLVTDKLVPAGFPVPGERVPKILDRLVVDSDHTAWANMLKSDRHVEDQAGEMVKQVHSVMIYPKGLRDYPDNTVRSMPWEVNFGIDNFYQDYPGKTADNPGYRQNKEIVLIAATLLSARPFGVVGVKRVIGFRENRVLSRMGDVMVRQSMAVCTIRLQPAQIPNS